MAGKGIIGSWRRLNLVGRIAIGLAAAVCVALLTRWLGGGTEGWEGHGGPYRTRSGGVAGLGSFDG